MSDTALESILMAQPQANNDQNKIFGGWHCVIAMNWWIDSFVVDRDPFFRCCATTKGLWKQFQSSPNNKNGEKT
jgi:hypothetical protein